MEKVSTYYTQLQAQQTDEIDHRYKQALYRKEGFYTYRDRNGIFKACIRDIEPNGRLILEDETGTHRGYMFKEVEYVL